MDRITEKNLEALVSRINFLSGTPAEPYETGEDGRRRPQANCYHLGYAYGGVSLHQMSSTPGCTGVRDVFNIGHVPKRELYQSMQAFISGINTKKGAAS